MAKIEKTKKTFADALKKLMENNKIDKIYTRDIIKTSGLSNKTFYRYFKDKQDLLAWMFHTEIASVIESIKLADSNIAGKIKKVQLYDKPFYISNFSHDQIFALSGLYWKYLGRYFYDNKDFYVDVFNSDCQNNLRDYLYGLFLKQFKEEVISILGNKQLDPIEIDFFAEYFTNACVGYMFRWVQSGMDYHKPNSLKHDFSLITQYCMKFTLELYTSNNPLHFNSNTDGPSSDCIGLTSNKNS